MELTYDMVNSMSLTLEQCHNIVQENIMGVALALGIPLLFLAGMFIYLAMKNLKLEKFIKDEKLQTKFQKWKSDNKGLN